MKKLSFLFLALLAMTTTFCNKPVVPPAEELPQIGITVDKATQTKITVSFKNNTKFNQYFILAIDTSEIKRNEQFTRQPLHRLIQLFGLKLNKDTTYTWKDMKANTTYAILALANDSTNPVHCKVLCTTPKGGGTGLAKLEIDLSDITSSSVKTIVTPNAETSVYYYGIIKTDTLTKWGLDSAINVVVRYNMQYPQYEKNEWVWNDLDVNTSFSVIGRGQNANDVWGDVARKDFKTLTATP